MPRSISTFSFLFAALFAPCMSWAKDLPDFRSLVKNNQMAVVNISTIQKKANKNVSTTPTLPNFPENSPFNDFLRRFFEGQGSAAPERVGIGSGFIISKDGVVLTNAHVVKDADQIRVKLSDSSEYQAKLIGLDQRTDVAVLQISATNLPTVTLGNSDQVEVGEWVLAIGSPFGLEHTATQGIVSATNRSLPQDAYVPFIQTDVAVNPGNSGGPLFNSNGEVIGINSQIYSRTGGYMGLSFAVPINTALQVAQQLQTKGEVSYGWLGVIAQPLTQDLAQSFNAPKSQGALIAQVLKNSPAAKAGIQSGDIIVNFDGKQILHSGDLPIMVGNTPIGKKVAVKIMRQGTVITKTVVIETLANVEHQPQG